MQTVAILRSYLFWIIFVVSSFLAAFLSWHYFPKSFPIVHLDITMDRAQAVTAAAELDSRFNWGPQDYQSAVSFDEEVDAKHFIELEGGGKEVLAQILEEGYYSLYTWQVRHFKEYEERETFIMFTPDGKAYGFKQEIPETIPGSALQATEAQRIAESSAKNNWNIDFSIYKLVESSQEKKISGRSDHIFIYERTDKQVGEGKYRLELVVSGNELTELSLSLKVPESFTRRYEHMRSANNTIAFGATIAMLLLYLLLGCLVGLSFLYRHRLIMYRPAIMWAIILAFLQAINIINYIPLRWMEYDTAIAKSGFLAQIAMSVVASFVSYSILLSIIFITAEGLTRAAFGNHPQFWNMWNSNAASSIQIIGRTIASYLLVTFEMLYVVIIYLFASRYFGWWSPSETLINPNILATYVPWLSAITHSVNAGFMEECLFRAIPLAGAYLLGKYWRKPVLFLTVAFIVQAIIFGAAHANYPAQPAYARLVELILPSALFAWLYLQFGLLVSVILHVIYDVIWFALPLFISKGLWFDRFAIILISLVPVWAIVYALWHKRKIVELAQHYYNYAWKPAPLKEKQLREIAHATQPVETKRIAIISISGMIGLLCWYFMTPFKQYNLPLTQNKLTIAKQSTDLLISKGITLTPLFKQFITASNGVDTQHTFVWQTAGKNAYKSLIGSYLKPANWQVRFAQFEGDIAERAEQFLLSIDGNNVLQSYDHQLPESRSAQSLSQQQARSLVHMFITDTLQQNPKMLDEISAISNKLPNRIDWTFTFSDSSIRDLKTGQARLDVKISGSEVTAYSRYIFIPEEWSREFRQKVTVLNIIKMGCIIILIIMMLLGSVYIFRNWHLFQFKVLLFFIWFIGLILAQLINNANQFEQIVSQFSSAQPYINQLGTTLIQIIVSIMLLASFIAYAASICTAARLYIHVHHTMWQRIILGVGLASIAAAFNAILIFILPKMEPVIGDYTYAGAISPVIGIILGTITRYIMSNTITMVLILTLDYIRPTRINRIWVTVIFACLFGLLMTGLQTPTAVLEWLVQGIGSGLILFSFYWLSLRFDRSIIPLLTAGLFLFNGIQQIMFNAWSGIIPGTILASLLICCIGIWWSSMIERFQRSS